MKSLSFVGPMVQAIRDGRKTQTRRVIKPQPHSPPSQVSCTDWETSQGQFKSPCGQRGTHIVMLCTWAAYKRYDNVRPTRIPKRAKIWTQFDGDKPAWCGRSRPGRFAPLHLRRFFPQAEITAVRVERVQDISRQDAVDEGIPLRGVSLCEDAQMLVPDFATLWDSINSKRGYGWDANPWVWAISFRKL